jgi:hypothetical protein
MKVIKTATHYIFVGRACEIRYIKGKGFKLRNLEKIRIDGGEFSSRTKYFPTLKEAIDEAKALGLD